ncbi:hypothetical protein [Natrinema soli]|uniref:PIN domain-containing protein n=1 Tax=Natrinema soli TaxID=1930624 RepID=A0ABD5SND8_9EURY|nr:hypothetical protein [Natrinema soli]
MSEASQLNLDTSVMVNYVYTHLPGDFEEDRGCQRLIDDESFYTVIGGKANGEFDALCERRYSLYDDVIAYLRDTDNEIFDYEPRDRDIHVSPNDRSHFRDDIQMSWYDMDKREQLSTLRRCLQDIELYQVQLPEELIDRRFTQQSNDQLLRRFRRDLDIGHDCEILVDAVEISRQHSISTLVAVDSHLTNREHIDVVHEIIEDVLGVSRLLRISEPEGVSAATSD